MFTHSVKPVPVQDYYQRYVDQTPEGDLAATLEAQAKEIETFFSSLPAEKLLYRYAEGKWTPLEILSHLADAERIFVYRALRFARRDDTPLSGFDENAYVPESRANARGLKNLLHEFLTLRYATIAMLRNLDDEQMKNGGIASGNMLTVERLMWVLPGHVYHHLRVLKERYL